VNAVSTPPTDSAGWRYPRTHPSLPESYHSIGVPKHAALVRRGAARLVHERAAQDGKFRERSHAEGGGAVVIMGLNGWLLAGAVKEWVA
jgi:hypothetical protein